MCLGVLRHLRHRDVGQRACAAPLSVALLTSRMEARAALAPLVLGGRGAMGAATLLTGALAAAVALAALAAGADANLLAAACA